MKLNRIKTALFDKNKSQTWLAERLGKSFSTINAYCCNRQQPNLENHFMVTYGKVCYIYSFHNTLGFKMYVIA